MDKEVASKDWSTLGKRAVHGDDGLWNHVFVVDIRGNTDDAARRHKTRLFLGGSRRELQNRVCPVDVAVERILAGKHPLGQRLTHDHDQVVIFTVGLVEVTALQNGNAHRSKKSR